ncbi:hypothetical protein JCM15457_1895 [Liquorilactobacillus sucicola DSM 21376 = JCM 15457]|uniref:Uncharacterized protein n=1 Tax=Liquorilactobacillus sucicola DSM 21376 = JCM 15457 TaxID=1423806 RepID=A0A023CZC4_9LACO|nr:hypothetical protein [Liquorilactobacillus sucicola]KRN06674.1 hypothetical protein FD15_GL000227 [Liquorilactobacillus sucicola DSM 21376 = JCM 15457]GAJ26941.1 hypothetical protein JCM15457_1895 [Liquorilactobacillus sucicola DSM 21376 = JCM 15457]
MLKRRPSNEKKHLRSCYTKSLLITKLPFAASVLIGLGKMICGIFFSSQWFIITAIYYLVLCSARKHILKKDESISQLDTDTAKFEQQFKLFRHSGIFICLIAIIYLLVCLYMLFFNKTILYPDYVIYGLTTITFYKLGAAFYKVTDSLREKDSAELAIRIISFIDAVVSIVMVQCALLTLEGSRFASTSSSIFGMGCSSLFFLVGLAMILRKKKYPEKVLLEQKKRVADK